MRSNGRFAAAGINALSSLLYSGHQHYEPASSLCSTDHNILPLPPLTSEAQNGLWSCNVSSADSFADFGAMQIVYLLA